MTPEEYIEYAVKGTERYYEFLKTNGKGKEEVRVVMIEKNGELYDLYLAQKLYDQNDVEFEIFNIPYSTEQIRPVKYDRRKGVLTVYPLRETLNDIKDKHGISFSEIPHDDIILKSSLLFLVKRVLDWYKKEGTIWTPTLPTVAPQGISYEKIGNYTPSAEQRKAIETAMTSALSYIWGAPGTGKTKFVLAHCLAAHIRADHRVIVCTPTNHALDQALFGVLEVLKSAGVATKTVFRLGTPSDRFAAAYPECCIMASIQNKITELTATRDSLQARIADLTEEQQKRYNYLMQREYTQKLISSLRRFLKIFIEAKEKTNALFYEAEAKDKELHELNERYVKFSDDLKKAKILVSSLEKETHTAKYFFSNLFKTAYSAELKYKLATECLKRDSIITDLNALDEEIGNIKSEIKLKEKQFAEKDGEKQVLISFHSFRRTIEYPYSSELFSVFKTISIYNAEECFAEAIEFTKERRKEANKYLKENSEDLTDEIESLKSQLSTAETELSGLSELSPRARIEDANVIAMTADQFVANFPMLCDFRNSIAQIFIDEAGYLCAAKGMTLFSMGVPITLLGDHMQLPPVCEMNFSKQKTDVTERPAVFWSLPIIYCCNIFEMEMDDLFFEFVDYNIQTSGQLTYNALTETFRFGKKLAEALSEYVYLIDLVSSSENETEVIVIDAPRSNDEKKPRENHNEARALIDYILNNKSDEIAVLTPYNDQRKLIFQELPSDKNTFKELILTVHKSQGQEWDTVVFSAVDTTGAWFTSTRKPITGGKQVLNTAISRAKKKLVIVCDYKYWVKQSRELLGNIVANADKVISY